MESLTEFLNRVRSATFLPLAAVLLLVVTAGSGLWKPRQRKLLFVVALAAVACVMAVGIVPQGSRGSEWREVLLNGQLL